MARRPARSASSRRWSRLRRGQRPGGDFSQHRDLFAPDPGQLTRHLPGPAPALTRRSQCAICPREGRGFGFAYRLRRDTFPFYRFCSRRCQEIGAGLANGNNGMIDKTASERQAIRDARIPFAEVLNDLGLMEPFFHRTADEIDRLIEAAVTGFVESMQRQAAEGVSEQPELDDGIPF